MPGGRRRRICDRSRGDRFAPVPCSRRQRSQDQTNDGLGMRTHSEAVRLRWILRARGGHSIPRATQHQVARVGRLEEWSLLLLPGFLRAAATAALLGPLDLPEPGFGSSEGFLLTAVARVAEERAVLRAPRTVLVTRIAEAREEAVGASGLLVDPADAGALGA